MSRFMSIAALCALLGACSTTTGGYAPVLPTSPSALPEGVYRYTGDGAYIESDWADELPADYMAVVDWSRGNDQPEMTEFEMSLPDHERALVYSGPGIVPGLGGDMRGDGEIWKDETGATRSGHISVHVIAGDDLDGYIGLNDSTGALQGGGHYKMSRDE